MGLIVEKVPTQFPPERRQAHMGPYLADQAGEHQSCLGCCLLVMPLGLLHLRLLLCILLLGLKFLMPSGHPAYNQETLSTAALLG